MGCLPHRRRASLVEWALHLPLTMMLLALAPVYAQQSGSPSAVGLGEAALRASRSLRSGGSGGSGHHSDSSMPMSTVPPTNGGSSYQSPEYRVQEPAYCDAEMATDMSMTGFRTTASFANGKGPCVVLLFESWTLRTPIEFCIGCLFSACLGLAMQAMANVLRRMERHYAAKLVLERGAKERLLVGVLYFVQMSLAYACMLIAMTYQVELFFSVCAGLTAGHVIFAIQPNSSALGQNLPRHEPCCSAEPSAANELSGVELRRVRAGPMATVAQE